MAYLSRVDAGTLKPTLFKKKSWMWQALYGDACRQLDSPNANVHLPPDYLKSLRRYNKLKNKFRAESKSSRKKRLEAYKAMMKEFDDSFQRSTWSIKQFQKSIDQPEVPEAIPFCIAPGEPLEIDEITQGQMENTSNDDSKECISDTNDDQPSDETLNHMQNVTKLEDQIQLAQKKIEEVKAQLDALRVSQRREHGEEQLLDVISSNATKIHLSIVRRDIPRASKAFNASRQAVSCNLKKISGECIKKVRSTVVKTSLKAEKDKMKRCRKLVNE
eukprot:gene9794-10420_t